MNKNIIKKKISKYLDQYNSSITYGKMQSDIFNQIILELKKLKVIIKFMYLVTEEVSIASHFSMDLTTISNASTITIPIITCFIMTINLKID